MKKSVFLLCALGMLVQGAMNAQFSKGNIMLGMTSSPVNAYFFDLGGTTNCLFFAGISSIESDDSDEKTKYKYINLSPTAGYFIIDNLVAGLSMNIFSLKFDDSYLERTGTWSLNPYIRYYYPFEKVSPFAELYAGYGQVNALYNTSGNDELKETARLFNLGGGAGAAVPIGGVVTIDIMGGYFLTTFKQEIEFSEEEDFEKTRYGTLGFKVGIHVFFSPGN